MGPKTSADADVSCKASSELRSDRIHLSHQTEGETQTEDCATSVCPLVIISRDNPLLPSRDPSCVSCLRQAGRRHRVSCCFLAKAAPASQSDSTTWAKQLVFSAFSTIFQLLWNIGLFVNKTHTKNQWLISAHKLMILPWCISS